MPQSDGTHPKRTNIHETGQEGRVVCHVLGSEDPHLDSAHKVIRAAVKVLAWLMVFVIIWGILDVLWVFYNKLITPPYFLLNINDLLATFGAFMAVLIAIEIFLNIAMYLEKDVIHVRLVLDTAVMAAARKVIVLDFNKLTALQVAALAAVLASLGICYYFVARRKAH